VVVVVMDPFLQRRVKVKDSDTRSDTEGVKMMVFVFENEDD